MYQVIQLTEPKAKSILSGSIFQESADQLYTEAVFKNGKEQLMPIVGAIQKIKDELDAQIEAQDKSIEDAKDARKKWKQGESSKKVEPKYFDPKAFWKNTLFRDLEDQFMKVFGFRHVSINPYQERYSSKEKIFESRELNACVYNRDRYPIDGLVTDNGFYDKTKSVVMEIYVSLGLIKALDAEEILAVILHEFGHSIDPALVDIKYTQTNILTKYMTDRQDKINADEKKFMNKLSAYEGNLICSIIYLMILLLPIIIESVKVFFSWIHDKIIGKDKAKEERLEKIRKMIEKDKSKFTRQEYSEAYADNFARMYGFGPQLMRALHKISADTNRDMKSRIKKERNRQMMIVRITADLIQDVHKTDIHRARALIREYKDDINDPNTPAPVKKQLEADLKELEEVLDNYMNNFDDFQNRVNQIINEELEKQEKKEDEKAAKESEKSSKEESKK